MSKEASTKEEETSPSLLSLPDAVALSCLARVSRADHAAFSLVSKRCRSLITSSELYRARLLMGQTKAYPYVCLSSKPYSTPLWFILGDKPRDFGPELIPAPSLPSQPHKFSTFVSLDCWIYVIGGIRNDARTSDVWLLDCRYNTWHQVPSMGVARAAAAAGVVDGKIYVFGGCEDSNSTNWAEVFNPKSQTWDTLVPMIDRNDDDKSICQTFVMDEKIYAVDIWNKRFYYSPSETKPEIEHFCSVIENLLYGCDSSGNIFWRKSVDLEWKKVKGMVALREIFPPLGVRVNTFETRQLSTTRVRDLSSFGSNIVVFWIGPNWCDVWCAEICLERHGAANEGEIWGAIEWWEAVTILDHDAAEVLYSVTVNV